MTIKVREFPYLDSAELFALIAHEPWAMFFDSGSDGHRAPRAETERFDLLLRRPALTLVTEGELTHIHCATPEEQKLRADTPTAQASTEDPLWLLQQQLKARYGGPADIAAGYFGNEVAVDKLAYLPGAYGYFAYDLARRFERLPEIAVNDEALPEMAVGLYDEVVMVDHQRRQTLLISWRTPETEARTTAEQWAQLIDAAQHRQTSAAAAPLQAEQLPANQTYAEYQRKFARVRDYTVAGDCYQVNLTKRFSMAVTGSSWSTYQHLRQRSPAPYGAFLQLPFAEVLSNSPESFIRCRNGQVTTSPIKGTRPRDHQNPLRDAEIAEELLNSAKDRAENVMIVDLMRNDLGRCCEPGSVHVPELYKLHSFANVHHLISKVVGVLRADLHALDLLRACFPGGSITGAPKIRAMEIIEELEPTRRGLYCGSIGYVGSDGSMETSIAIRTMVVKDGVARYSAGGGLVVDSVAEEEYAELVNKASMLKSALLQG